MSVLGEQKEYDGQQIATDTNGRTKLIRVTEDGYSVVDSVDAAGRNSFNDISGGSLSVIRQQEMAVNFSNGVEEKAINKTLINLGVIQQVGSKFSIESGASANSSAMFQSIQTLKCRAGKSFEGIFTTRFSAPEIGNTRSIGLFDDLTGVAIRLIDDELNFSVKRDNNWIINIPQSEWNEDKCDGEGYSKFNLNTSNLAIYRITGGSLGIAPLTLEVYAGRKSGFIECHTIDSSNSSIDTNFNYSYLSIRAESINTTATGNNTVQMGSVSTAVFDGNFNIYDPDASSREFTIDTGYVTLVGTVETVVGIFQNDEIHNGLPNRIMSRLLSVSTTTDGSKPVIFTVKKLGTPPTGGTWTPVHPTDSILSRSLDATVTQTQLDNAELLFAMGLGVIDSQREYIANLNIRLFPSEYAVLTMESKNASDVRVAFRESERF